MFVAVVFVLSCLARHGHAACSKEEEQVFINENLGEDCRNKLSLLDVKNPAVLEDDSGLNSICMPDCLGRYSSWLSSTCNETGKAWFQRAACLQQHDKQDNKRCRLFFPDFVNITTARQCWTPISGSNPMSCSPECRNQLQDLITRLGCCFETIYDNAMVTDGLRSQRFLTNEEFIVLKAFQASNILKLCFNQVPPACIGDFFSGGNNDGTSGAAGMRSNSLFIMCLIVMASIVLLFTMSI